MGGLLKDSALPNPMNRPSLVSIGLALLVSVLPACSKKQGNSDQAGLPKSVSKLEAAEADNLVSDAVFAMQIKDHARAAQNLEKALAIRPDVGEWWENLGYCYKLLDRKSDARSAYKKAVGIWDSAYDKTGRIDYAMRQLIMLVLLDREDDARALLTKLTKKHPEDPQLHAFVEKKGLESLLSDPGVMEKKI